MICLQRLIASRALPSHRLKDVLAGLRETTNLSKQQATPNHEARVTDTRQVLIFNSRSSNHCLLYCSSTPMTLAEIFSQTRWKYVQLYRQANRSRSAVLPLLRFNNSLYRLSKGSLARTSYLLMAKLPRP